MTIQFIYSNEEPQVYVEARTDEEHLDAVVESFRAFLLHIGHHPDNVERVQVVGREETQGFPVQLDLFDEDMRAGGTD